MRPTFRSIVVIAVLAGATAACATETTTPAKTTTPATKTAPATTGATPAAAPPAAGQPVTIPAPPDVAAPPADAIKSASGLATKVLKPGTGKVQPKPYDTVEVHYSGWTTDGNMFDSSVARGETIKFALNRVIKGWTEGVGLMVIGERRRLWIPEPLAYGGRPGAPAGMLVFDVELIGITPGTPPPPPPEVPVDVAAPPADAKKTASGIAYKVQKRGTGTVHPDAADAVEVHYSGWTTDGKMFDSSVMRGRPATFPLNGVIAGWTEGVQLMVEGEKTRFWIPKDLAYGDGGGGRPGGTLVFDIELLKINKR